MKRDLFTITTPKGKKYTRCTWTGGDEPPRNWENLPENTDLIEAFLIEQVEDYDSIYPTPADVLDIFTQRAIFDAFVTKRFEKIISLSH